MSLAARLVRSSLLNFADHLVKFAAMFLLTPVLIAELGDYRYGVWLLVMAFFSYYTLLDLGVGLASVRFLSRAIGRDGVRGGELPAIITAARGIFHRIGLVSLLLTAAGLATCGLFFESAETAAAVRWVILIYGAGIALRFSLMVYPAILKAHVAYGAIGASSVARTLVQTALSLWVLKSGGGIVALAAVFGCCDIAQQLFLAAFARSLLKTQGVSPGDSRPGLGREMFKYSMGTFATRMAINLKDRIDPFVVAGVAGAGTVPIFSIGSRFLVIARDLTNALFGGQFLAAFSTVDASAGRAALRAQFLAAQKLAAGCAAFFGCGLAMLGPAFIERWVGADFAQSADVLLVLVIPYGLFLIQYPGLGLMFSIDAHRTLAKIAWGGSALNLALSIALGMRFGLMGVVWATVVDLSLVYGILFPIAVTRAVGIPLGTYLRTLVTGAVAVVAPAAAYYLAVRPWIQPDYLKLCLVGGGLGLIYLLVLRYLSGWRRGGAAAGSG